MESSYHDRRPSVPFLICIKAEAVNLEALILRKGYYCLDKSDASSLTSPAQIQNAYHQQ